MNILSSRIASLGVVATCAATFYQEYNVKSRSDWLQKKFGCVFDEINNFKAFHAIYKSYDNNSTCLRDSFSPSLIEPSYDCDWGMRAQHCFESFKNYIASLACHKKYGMDNLPDDYEVSYTPVLAIGLVTVIAIVANEILVRRRSNSERSISTESSQLQSQTKETQLESSVTNQDQVEGLASEESSESSL